MRSVTLPSRHHHSAAVIPQPTHDAPPARFAHRAQQRDVLITGWTRRGTMDFSVRVDWSAGHRFFTPTQGSAHHHMLIAQTIRQVGLTLAHAAFDVPVSDKFLMNELTYTTDPHHRTTATDPVQVDTSYTWQGRRSLRVETVMRQRGSAFATSDSVFSWVSPQVYGRLRGDHLTAHPGERGAPVPPPAVGRIAENEVVLAPADRPRRWKLRGDTGHPALIDHHVDHAPGLVLLEAAHQAAYSFAGAPHFNPTAVTMSASRYVEYDSTCWIEAHATVPRTEAATAVEIVGVQRDSLTFRCVVEGFPIRG